MIGSLTKIIFFIIIIATVSIAAGAIIDAGGVITMQFASYEVSLTPIQGIIGIILCLSILLAAKWIFGIIVAIFKFFNGDETAITRYFNKNKARTKSSKIIILIDILKKPSFKTFNLSGIIIKKNSDFLIFSQK